MTFLKIKIYIIILLLLFINVIYSKKRFQPIAIVDGKKINPDSHRINRQKSFLNFKTGRTKKTRKNIPNINNQNQNNNKFDDNTINTIIDEKLKYFIPAIPNEKNNIKNTTNPLCYTLYNRCLPYFIAGTFKSGTTSLYKYLSFHPQISINIGNNLTTVDEQTKYNENIVHTKEIGFLNRMPPINIKEAKDKLIQFYQRQETTNTNTNLNIKEYLDNFPVIYENDDIITGEGTPNYLPSPNTSYILNLLFPWAKSIITVREPIYRAYSRMSHLFQMICIQGQKKIMNKEWVPYVMMIIYNIFLMIYYLIIKVYNYINIPMNVLYHIGQMIMILLIHGLKILFLIIIVHM